MPIISLFSKIKARSNWIDEIGQFLDNEIILKIIEMIAMLIPSWHGENSGLGAFHFYAKWSIYNFIIIIILIIFKKRVFNILRKFIFIFNDNKIVMYTIISLALLYNTKIFLGFHFSGIPGWDYSNNAGFGGNNWEEPTFASKRYETRNFKKIDINKFNRLIQGVDKERAKLILNNDSIRGNVILAYINDEAYPINDGLSGVVFPYKFVDSPEKGEWLRIINHRIKRIRNYNPFWKSIRYPDHTIYMDFGDEIFFKNNLINKIEYWEIELSEINNKIEITDAKLKLIHD